MECLMGEMFKRRFLVSVFFQFPTYGSTCGQRNAEGVWFPTLACCLKWERTLVYVPSDLKPLEPFNASSKSLLQKSPYFP